MKENRLKIQEVVRLGLFYFSTFVTISANVIAAYHHDYIFVQAEHAHIAPNLLKEFAS